MALGRQMIVEFYDCDSEVLADAGLMERIFLASAAKAKATIISSHFHGFSPQGVSGVVVIAESHFTVHAWPEHDYAAVDIFTCGESIDFDTAVKELQRGMKSECVIVSDVISRGVVSNHGVEHAAPAAPAPAEHHSLSWRSRFERINARGFSTLIDIYDCSPELIAGALPLDALISGIAAGIGSAALAEAIRYRTGDGLAALRQDFADGQLTGHLDPATGTVYLDLFCSKFFDPRPVAEAAVACLGGKHYRLQIAIRR